MLFIRDTDIKSALRGIIEVNGNDLEVIDAEALRQRAVDRLVYNALFHEDEEVRYYVSWMIREAAAKLVIYPASARMLYQRLGRGATTDFTTPSLSIRALPYDTARATIRAAKERAAGAFAFELSDAGSLSPLQYATSILAAAIKEHYQGPIFLQLRAALDRDAYHHDREREMDRLTDLVEASINAGFFNLDFDTSALVDLSPATFFEQQKPSYVACAELAASAWRMVPPNMPLSIGADIGNVDDRGRAAEYLRSFIDGFGYELHDRNAMAEGLSKVTVAPRLAPISEADFNAVESELVVLHDIGEVARRDYGIGGIAVRSSDWALAQQDYPRLRRENISEVHLETRFEDAVFDHPAFPGALKEMIYQWVDSEFAASRRPGESDTVFYHRIRAKAFAPYLRDMWDMPLAQREGIMQDVEAEIATVMDLCNVSATAALIRDTIDIHELKLTTPISGYMQTAEATLNAIIAGMERR